MADSIHFYLNDREVQTSLHPGVLVLDFVRGDRRLTGTKEGCREGDCGACVVLVGELNNEAVTYKSVTSCLMPIGELHGKHLVTVEGLNLATLSPVQEAIVEEGATQCGFCTPGIVVSLTGYLIERGDAAIDREGVKTALGGHLCRCTGYRSLKASTERLQQSVANARGVTQLADTGALPAYFLEIPSKLKAIAQATPPNGQASAFAVAGGTDIYVQRGDDIPGASVSVLNLNSALRGIAETDTHLDVGALTTFEEFAQSAAVAIAVPAIAEYMSLIASVQIRNRATLGGNVVNASPIGDMTILLLALDAELSIRNGASTRTVRLRKFYQGYKEIDLHRGEVVERIRIPKPDAQTRVNWEKVSKRKYLDIASVNSAAKLRIDGDIITSAAVAVGGVAPVPLFLTDTSEFLAGKPVSRDTILEADAVAQREIAPIDDIRGSAAYKRLAARQLLLAHFVRIFPQRVRVEELYEAR